MPYSLSVGNYRSLKKAREDYAKNGSGEIPILYIPLDAEDPGVAAFIAVTRLATEAMDDGVTGTPLEQALLQIYIARRKLVPRKK